MAKEISKTDFNDFYRCGARHLGSPHHWAIISDVGEIRKNKDVPNVYCFGGNGEFEDKAVNTVCRKVQEISGKTPGVDINTYGFRYIENNAGTEAADKLADVLLEHIISPIFTNGTADGHQVKKPYKQAMDNVLQNSVFFSHCYGSRILTALDDKVYDFLGKIGYSSAEKDNLCRQFVVFHHNNPLEEINDKPRHFLHINSITQTDEHNHASRYCRESLAAFMRDEPISADNKGVLIFKPKIADGNGNWSEDDNTLVMLMHRAAADKGISEHNTAFLLSHDEKTSEGQFVEDIEAAILKFRLNHKQPVSGMDELINEALKLNPDLSEQYNESFDFGTEFADDYTHEASASFSFVKTNANKMLHNRLTEANIAAFSAKELFTMDEQRQTLLDYAVKYNRVEECDLLWQKMVNAAEVTKDGQHKTIAKNYHLIAERRLQYMQAALDNNQPEIFDVFAQINDQVQSLDYTKATTDTIAYISPIVAEVGEDAVRKNDADYYATLAYLYHRCLQSADNSECSEASAELEKLLFNKRTTNYKSLQNAVKGVAKNTNDNKLLQKCDAYWGKKHHVNILVNQTERLNQRI